MQAIPVVAIFDIGKTNKKLFLFDEQYQIVYEENIRLKETVDEDGDACEDIDALAQWVTASFEKVCRIRDFNIKAVNFSAYGASLVYIDKNGATLTPLYNYLKRYPASLQQDFFSKHGGDELLCSETASPSLGSLNSGLQLYRIKHEKANIFERTRYAVHLPQYISYVLCRMAATDISSIGCHTMLWNFAENNYHHWVMEEGCVQKFAPIKKSNDVTQVLVGGKHIAVGIGLHDSSAALIPYLSTFSEPFVLISTGTWCISLNPFNDALLTLAELHKDCLCYLTYDGKPVKASRLFAGHEHEIQIAALAAHFDKPSGYYQTVLLDKDLLRYLKEHNKTKQTEVLNGVHPYRFSERKITQFSCYEEAYHQLMIDIVDQQVASTALVLSDNIMQIFVDGGFSKNPIYMYLLAAALPQLKIYAASVAQASAVGAALAIHTSWNSLPMPQNIIALDLHGSK